MGQSWDRFGKDLENDLNTDRSKNTCMDTLNIKTLKEIVERLPEDFDVEFKDKNTVSAVGDKFEIDVSEKKLILHKY